MDRTICVFSLVFMVLIINIISVKDLSTNLAKTNENQQLNLELFFSSSSFFPANHGFFSTPLEGFFPVLFFNNSAELGWAGGGIKCGKLAKPAKNTNKLCILNSFSCMSNTKSFQMSQSYCLNNKIRTLICQMDCTYGKFDKSKENQ